MRPFLALLMWVVVLNAAHATVYTLCNMPYSPGQYTTFDDAQNAASGGDTIYVHGSSISYGNISINKELVIIGTGHNPEKQYPLVSSFSDIQINVSNVQLIGVRTSRLYSYGTSNCVLRKCRLQNQLNFEAASIQASQGWLIEGNIIESTGVGLHFSGYSSPGTVIRNNVFITFYGGVYGIHNNSSQQSYVLNNTFLGSSSNSNPALYDNYYCNFENNIFHSAIPELYLGNNNNCVANNNISYGSVDDTFYSPGANNLVNVDPQFNNFTPAPATFDYSWDLNLSPTSLGHNTGTDGTDRGIFGGIGELFTITGEPAIAEITVFTITSPTTIAPGGTLTISVTSKRVH